jgi:hypothetical protein
MAIFLDIQIQFLSLFQRRITSSVIRARFDQGVRVRTSAREIQQTQHRLDDTISLARRSEIFRAVPMRSPISCRSAVFEPTLARVQPSRAARLAHWLSAG